MTSQSIAQISRSLSISLGDESKTIIVTIPKLGYQLSAQPTQGVAEVQSAASRFELCSPENVSFTTRAIIDLSPVNTTAMSAISYPGQPEKALALKTMLLSAVGSVLFSSLIVTAYIYFRFFVR